MTPTDYAHARQILVGAFVAASNPEAQAIIFNAQAELFLEDFAKKFNPEPSVHSCTELVEGDGRCTCVGDLDCRVCLTCEEHCHCGRDWRLNPQDSAVHTF